MLTEHVLIETVPAIKEVTIIRRKIIRNKKNNKNKENNFGTRLMQYKAIFIKRFQCEDREVQNTLMMMLERQE